MRSNKLRILAAAVFAFSGLRGFAHDTPTGMHITTKSPKAHASFEQGLKKMEMLHLQAGLENFRSAVKADPKFALGHIFLTFFSQDPAEQVAERDKALASRASAGPEEKLIIDWLASASQSRWIPAIQAMNEALQTYPRDKHLHWLAGWWLAVNQNQWRRAIPRFERVIEIDPKFADAWNEVAYCYAKTDNFEKAFADIKHYTELVPNEANPQDSFAEISRMAGKFDDALKHYHMSLKIDPTFHESQLGLGDTYALMGDEPQARAEYAIAIQLGTKVQAVTWSLQSAATYIREGDASGADLAFQAVAQRAHSDDFGNLEAEAYRSMALYQKDSAAAMAALQKAELALQDKHNLPQSIIDVGRASILRVRVERAARDGNKAVAAEALKQLENLTKGTSDENVQLAYHGASGALLMAQGKYEEAIAHLEEDERNPFSMQRLTVAYEKTGAKEKAERMAARLSGFNEPLIEQAVVVPAFRKQRAGGRVQEKIQEQQEQAEEHY